MHIPSIRCPGRPLAALTLLAALVMAAAAPALASRVLLKVNDVPVTNFDITQQLKINGLLGGPRTRQAALRQLVDNVVLEREAKRQGITIRDIHVDRTIDGMAKSFGGLPRLKQLLRKRGVRYDAFRRHVRGLILFRAVTARLGTRIKVAPSKEEIERRYRKILTDPRLKPVTAWRLRQVTLAVRKKGKPGTVRTPRKIVVWNLRNIDLPVENVAPVMREQLFQARAIESQQIKSRYRGCASIKQATAGLFNVRVSGIIQADPRLIPGPVKQAMREAGTTKLLGPVKTRKGIRLIAFCGAAKTRPSVKVPDVAVFRRIQDAQIIMRRFRGCATLPKAAHGVRGARVSDYIDADPRKLPRQLRVALAKSGGRKLIGPVRTPRGIQLFAFCGKRKIVPPKPDRKIVARMVQAEAFQKVREKVMRKLRQKAYIEIRDKSVRLN